LKKCPELSTFSTPLGERGESISTSKSTRFSTEIKSGYVRATDEFRSQVRKDVWLIENRPDLVSEVT
jgi:hypothetical protein